MMFDDQVATVREPPATESRNRLLSSAKPRPGGGFGGDRGLASGSLAQAVLQCLPMAVAVLDANLRLLYWNQCAARLLRFQPSVEACLPHLAGALSNLAGLTLSQRNRIVAFSAAHVATGSGSEPNSRLRLSLGTHHRLTVQVCSLGRGRWMLALDQGKLTLADCTSPELAVPPRGKASAAAGDAWLDGLTGLGNRRRFNLVLDAALGQGRLAARQAILLIDVDRFTRVNDIFGHTAGDALLCLVAKRLSRETRAGDVLARLGGDKFGLLIRNGGGAEALASRIVIALSRPFMVEGKVVTIGASAGIVQLPNHAATTDDLLRCAEAALFDAKSPVRGTWRVFEWPARQPSLPAGAGVGSHQGALALGQSLNIGCECTGP